MSWRKHARVRWNLSESPTWTRGTTRQVCGLWPLAGGAGAPRKGVPAGRHLRSHATVACDPITYFKTGLIGNPSMWVEGKPGLGKSTFGCRLILGLEDMGIPTLVLGDLKPDYIKIIKALGGQVISVGRGRGHRNPLDHQYALDWANAQEAYTVTDEDGTERVEYRFVLPDQARKELLADAHSRRLNGIKALLNVLRREPLSEREDNVLDQALVELGQRWHGPAVAVPLDLVQIITGQPLTRRDGTGRKLPALEVPVGLREAAMDRGSSKRYSRSTERLVETLTSIAKGSAFGGVFSERSEVSIDMNRSMVFDVSSIDHNDTQLQAAVLLTCWNEGFGQVDTMQMLADYKIIPRRNWHVIMDELWRPLASGSGMVDRISAATRLNRTWGVGISYFTHSLADLDSLPTEEDRNKARGIAERCGLHVYFGLPRAEMVRIDKIQQLTRSEKNTIVGWWTPDNWDQHTDREPPPGLGKCMIKVAGRRGIPIQIKLTPAERQLHNTNERWAA